MSDPDFPPIPPGRSIPADRLAQRQLLLERHIADEEKEEKTVIVVPMPLR
ncbi:hypothetical protein [Parafrankia elaeagni]|nr:hypothetical protein [Parafrankia elaeagni]